MVGEGKIKQCGGERNLMWNSLHIKHVWLILAAYGVWFAAISGAEEVLGGKVWKVILAVVLGILSYVVIERKIHK